MKENLLKKKQLLRNNEYYDIQDIFDKLYEESRKGNKFVKLMQYVTSRENILLAYRNIKKNDGSVTAGTDGLDITFIENMGIEKYIQYIQRKFDNYHPKSVRRVEIPKPNGKIRPLGIPCIDDRLIQQCIKQMLEPICEAKFHKHSYGFRPNRSPEHAIARCMALMNKSNLHYVVDIDIKSFFDNVSHSKLKKQLWNIGIQDKNLITLLGKILKSNIEGIGIPTKGTPQGGIISPLLSNVVLNELDWWISSQWESFQTKKDYKVIRKRKKVEIDLSNKFRALKETKLKEVWIVRYADDFKIFCKNYETAQKIFIATKRWLKERLSLDISDEKSKITNLRKKYTEFLGIKLKVVPKSNKYICESRMSDKSKKSTINKLKKQIKKIQKNTNPNEVIRLNSIILGSHNYYKMATHANLDFQDINFLVRRTLYNRFKHEISDKPFITKTYERLYGKYNGKPITICKTTIFPIYGCKTKPPMCFTQEICNYTVEGRKVVHDKLRGFSKIIKYLLENPLMNQTAELNDNRISLYVGQMGKCYVTKKSLKIGNMECHHKIPKHLGGTDEYKNLVWINSYVHKLVHSTLKDTIQKYLGVLNLSAEGLKRVNSLRKLVGNSVI